MTSTDKDLSESNSALEDCTLPKKIIRPKKSTKLKDLPSTRNIGVNRRSISPVASTKIGSKTKDLKLFPIFNLSVCKNSAMSGVKNDVIALESHSPEELKKCFNEKRDSVTKGSNMIYEDGNDLGALKDRISYLADSAFATEKKITLCDTEDTVSETNECLSSEIEEALTFSKHSPVSINDSSENVNVTAGSLSEPNSTPDTSRVNKRKVDNLLNCMNSENLSNPQIYNSAPNVVKNENNNKECKVFPIFNLIVNKSVEPSSDSINTHDWDTTHTNKRRKCSPKINSKKNNINFNPHLNELRKSSRKKNNAIKSSEINCEDNKSVTEFQGSMFQLSHVSDMSMDKNKNIPCLDIDDAITETVDYVCSQVTATLTKHLPVNYINMNNMKANFVDLDTQGNYQNLTYSSPITEVTNLSRKRGRHKKLNKSNCLMNVSKNCVNKSVVDLNVSLENHKCSNETKFASDTANLLKKLVKSHDTNLSEDCVVRSLVKMNSVDLDANHEVPADISSLPKKVGRPKKLIKSKCASLANYENSTNGNLASDSSNLTRKVGRPKKMRKSDNINLPEDLFNKSLVEMNAVNLDATLSNHKNLTNCCSAVDVSSITEKVDESKTLKKSKNLNLSQECIELTTLDFDASLVNNNSSIHCKPSSNVTRKSDRLRNAIKLKSLNSSKSSEDNCMFHPSNKNKTETKELKTFAIFNLLVCKNPEPKLESENNADQEECTLKNKQHKCICNSENGAIYCNVHSSVKDSKKANGKKQNAITNDLDIRLYEDVNDTSKLQKHVNHTVPITKHVEILDLEDAIIKTVDYLCDQVQVSTTCSNYNYVNKSVKINSVDNGAIQSNNVPLFCIDDSDKQLESEKKSNKKKTVRSNLQTIKIQEQEKVEETVTFSNSNSVDSFVENSSVDQIAIQNGNIPQLCIVSSDKQFKSKNKHKEKKIYCVKSPTSMLQNSEKGEENSTRRRSLRSRGMRDNLINYSEDDSNPKPIQKGKSKFQLPSNQGRKESITVNKKPNCNVDIISTSKSKTPKHQAKSKNMKENLKLFSIFTSSKLELNSSLTKSGEKKIKAIEVCTEENAENNVNIKHKISSKKKRDKNEFNINCVKKCLLVSQDLANTNKECSETEIILDISGDSDVCVVQENEQNNSIYEKNSVKENLNKSIEVSAAKSIIIKKPVQLDQTTIACFPLFSHLQLCSATFSDSSSKFKIIDEASDYCIDTPTWTHFAGLVDFESVQKSNLNDSEKELLMSSTCNSSDVITDESDILWTDCTLKSEMKLQNNLSIINDIKSWLLQWKNKFCNYVKKDGDSSNYDSSGSDSDDSFIYNGIIISGAPGSGKTSLVFSLANELGFTVIEVNASSCRNGRNISHQLKEALESYHVESIRVEDSKVDSMFKKNKTVNRSESDNSLEKYKSNGIKSFFKTENKKSDELGAMPEKRKQNTFKCFQVNDESEGKQKKKSKRSLDRKKNYKEADASTLKNDKHSYKISGLTIVLFDDVDVIFEEDEGFWSTVKGFLKISKKPVIFTVSRNLSIVKAALNSGIQIFDMKPATKEIAVKKLREHCKEHSRENTSVDFELLTSHNSSDLRRSILNAQFWTQSPTNVIEVKSKAYDTNEAPVTKLVHVNTFLTGDLNFSTNHIRKLLFDSLPYTFSNAVLQYQSLGYDILYCNLYNILYNLRLTDCEKLWQMVILESQKSSCSNSKKFADSELWKEACALFERKKKALKSGSSSKELKIIADVLEEFSYTDVLKGICNTFQWIAMSERVKMWTAGLPICSDQVLQLSDNILDIISLLHIYRLRSIDKTILLNYSELNEDSHLNLEYPCFNFDESFDCKTEKDLKCISSCLPVSQLLNRTALNLDYLSTIRIICQDEESRQLNSGKRSGRFLHYFDSISFYLDYKDFLSK